MPTSRPLRTALLGLLVLLPLSRGPAARADESAPAPAAPAAAAAAAPGAPGATPTIFPLADVKPGLKGYGLTVKHGTKIERFEVEVLDVMRQFQVKQDVILVRC